MMISAQYVDGLELRIRDLEAELAALKAGQGEPVAWMDKNMEWAQNAFSWTRNDNDCDFTTPVYTSAQTMLTEQAPCDIPEGWVMVPIEPTDEQKWKGVDVAQSFGAKVSDIYKAMLAAAPKPEEMKLSMVKRCAI